MKLQDFVGQEDAKANIQLLLESAKLGHKLCHILLCGPAGDGKTTLGHIIAEELGAELIYINGAAVSNTVVFRKPIKDAIVAGPDKKFIVLLDEAHASPKQVQDNLLSALEEPAILCTKLPRRIQISNGKFLEKGEILKEKLPDNVTFILCTTNKERLSDPLLSRLHHIYLDAYPIKDKIQNITKLLAGHNIECELAGLEILANASKTMRHATRLSERLIGYAAVNQIDYLDSADIIKFLAVLGIDKYGRDKLDKEYITYLEKYEILSLSNIARYLNTPEKDVRDKIEPFLIRHNWIYITPKGRRLTEEARKLFFQESISDTYDDIQDILGELNLL